MLLDEDEQFICGSNVINFQRAPGKKADLENMSDYMHPDVLIPIETKLDPSIKPAECPTSYDIHTYVKSRAGRDARAQG